MTRMIRFVFRAAAVAVAATVLALLGASLVVPDRSTAADSQAPQAAADQPVPVAPAFNLPETPAASAPAPQAPSVHAESSGASASFAPRALSGDPRVVQNCLVTATYVDVPAEEPGRLVTLHVKEGQFVKKSDVLAQIDDRTPQMAKLVADAKLKAAKAEAENDVNIEYASASHQVAVADWKGAIDADTKQPGTIPRYEMRRYQLKWEESRLQIEQAKHEKVLATIKVGVQEAELQASEVDIERRKIMAQSEGVIEKRYKEEGDWVKPGDPVFRLLELKRLKVEGYVDALAFKQSDVIGRPVTFTCRLPGGEEATFQGKIIDASRQISSGPRFQVKAEVENRQGSDYWLLNPGLEGDMTIDVKGK